MLERRAAFMLAALALVSFYLFSRFTVDDAFISWRYGKNLIESGIWGYNPSHFDLTQAYTNPIIAVLSIIPAALGIDVVLFFKLVSLVCLLLPYIYIRKRVAHTTLFSVLYLALLVLPATMIHAFSGLETFLFIGLLGMLWIALLRADIRSATVLAIVLLLVRPEAWLMVGLVPAYFFYTAVKKDDGYGICWRHLFHPAKLKPALKSSALLGGCFVAYALFHWDYFGYILPNTFYIKSHLPLNPKLALWFCVFLLPSLLLLHRHRIVLVAMLGMYLPMVYNYASSDLQMNYAGRFAYHMMASLYLVLCYLAANEPTVQKRYTIAVVAAMFMGIFALHTSHPAGLLNLANYYPRALHAHAALGKKIAALHTQYGIQRFALSDAGMAAYQTKLVAFDNTGLGSSMVAHQGPTIATIAAYHPDLVVLYADSDGVVLSNQGKKNLLQWATVNQYESRCDVYLKPKYRLRLFSANPLPEFAALCAESKAINNRHDAEFFQLYNTVPPWHFWRE